MLQKRREVRSLTYYILGTDSSLFGNVFVRDPLAQLVPIHGPGLPAKRLPDIVQEVFRGKEAVADEAYNEANTGRKTVSSPTEGRPKSATTRGKTKNLDIRGDVKAR